MLAEHSQELETALGGGFHPHDFLNSRTSISPAGIVGARAPQSLGQCNSVFFAASDIPSRTAGVPYSRRLTLEMRHDFRQREIFCLRYRESRWTSTRFHCLLTQ